MFFEKISILAWLVLCTILTGECCRHPKSQNCGCSHKSKPDVRGNPNPNVFRPNKDLVNSDKYIKIPNDQYFESRKANALRNTDGNHKSSIPIQNFHAHTNSDGNIHVKPLSYPSDISTQETSYLNGDPHLTEAILKQIWLSHQLDNVNQGQNPKFDSEIRRDNNLLQLHNVSNEDYVKDLNNYVKIDMQQNNQPSEWDFLAHPLLEQQFHTNYHDNTRNPNTGWDSESDNDNTAPDSDAGVRPSGSSLGEFKYNYPNNYGINNIKKQQEKIPLPLPILPFAERVVDNQQENYTAYSYLEPYEHNDNNAPHKNNAKRIPNTDTQENIMQRQIYSIHPETYVDYTNNIPTTHNTNLFPDEEFKFKINDLIDQQNYNILYNPNNEYKHQYQIPVTHIPLIGGKFGKWVSDQTEVLNNRDLVDKVDLSDLQYSILQILSENDMHVTDNGMLADTYGTLSNIHTLSLTPIIIGNTLPLKQLLKGKYGVMSSKLQAPYLHAILVSATHPHKVLGIMPLGTTYLPLSTMANVTNIWDSIPNVPLTKNPDKDELVVEKESASDVPENRNIEKSKKFNHDDGDVVNSDHYFYNSDRIGPFNMFPPTRGLMSEDETNDNDSYSINFKPINQEVPESEAGTLFMPRKKIREEPLEILTRSATIPVSIGASETTYHEPTRIEIPIVSSFLNTAFSHKKIPVSNTKRILNNIAAETSDSFAGKFGDLAHKKLDFMKQNMPLAAGQQILPNKRLQIVADIRSILKWMSQGHAIPPDYVTPEILSPVDELDFESRTGDLQPVLPEIPLDEVHEDAFDEAENDDDYDGDFRIIGGNAATGSGTPLSNKGR